MRRPISRPNRGAGFTLVELLVVIGIIALLISILLPALNKARRAANTMKCSSNMRQIALGMIAYATDNKGKLPPAYISADATAPNGLTGGWWWASELVRQKYVNAPNLYRSGGTTKDYTQSSVFQCPEGLTPGDWPGQSGTGSGSYGLYPCSALNNNYVTGLSYTNPNFDIATWYEPVTRVSGYASNDPNSGTSNTPFIYFDSSKDSDVPAGTPATMAGQLMASWNQRSLSNVRKSASLVMLGEADAINWVDQTPQTRNGETMCFTRMGARHGQVTVNGNNAFTNLAFFDGHVELMPTMPFQHASITIGTTTYTGDQGCTVGNSGAVFIFANQ